MFTHLVTPKHPHGRLNARVESSKTEGDRSDFCTTLLSLAGLRYDSAPWPVVECGVVRPVCHSGTPNTLHQGLLVCTEYGRPGLRIPGMGAASIIS